MFPVAISLVAVSALDVPPARRAAIARVAAELIPGRRAVLSTHMNADGDACGSVAAFAGMMLQLGLEPRIINPTPWPASFDFLLPEGVRNLTDRGAAGLKPIDLLAVLDVSDVKRLGNLADAVRGLAVPKLVIDHHIASPEPAGDILFADTSACATGELLFDLAVVLGLELTVPIATALYAAILTDTGGFRFSNTTPRAHAIAAELLRAGVDPEEMYIRIYATVSPGRLFLLRDALDTLQVDGDRGISWISLPAGVMEKHAVSPDDLDGIVEHPRSIAGTRLAIFFRDLGYGKVKVSFRSTGAVDVNRLAREFGGGGHAKAAGALIPGALEEVQTRVLAAARQLVAATPEVAAC
jgi:bifunctional oligoribonuclease and PAP phosphatase NrnA